VTKIIVCRPGTTEAGGRVSSSSGNLKFSGDFEGGNLGKVVVQEPMQEYAIWLRPDTGNERFRLWFHFQAGSPHFPDWFPYDEALEG
jgi:hypothetical protein